MIKRGGHWELAFWVMVALAGVVFDYHLPLLTLMLIYGLFAVSLDVVLGYAGILTVGHAAFFGLGAYAAGLFAIYIWAEPLSGLVVAAVLCAVVGYVLSYLVVRGTDLSRLMITIAIVMLLAEVVRRFSAITGGTDGLLGIAMAPLLGHFEFDFMGQVGFIYSYVVVLGVFLVVRQVVRSPFGYGLRAIQDNALRAQAMGINVAQHLRWGYAFSAMVAGVAGALLAQTQQFVGIESVGFDLSAQVLIMLIIGGTGRLYGGLVGAIIYTLLQDYFADRSPEYWMVALGVFLVVSSYGFTRRQS